MTTETETTPKPFVFVLIPFDAEFDDIYKFGIKGAADDVGAYAERLDEQIFSEGMLDRIFNQISKADVVVADMTGRNPNVFYEVGYAHALGKAVLLLTQNARQHTVYGGRIETLRKELASKLEWAIAESKKQSSGGLKTRISVRVHNSDLLAGLKADQAPHIDGDVRGRSFTLPLLIRNDSARGVLNVTHVYLFADPNAKAIPAAQSDFPYFSTTMTLAPKTQPTAIPSFRANPIDAPDGLKSQYRLPVSFTAVPPGAIEQELFRMKIDDDQDEVDETYRLRVHTTETYYDYYVRLSLRVKPADDGKPDA